MTANILSCFKLSYVDWIAKSYRTVAYGNKKLILVIFCPWRILKPTISVLSAVYRHDKSEYLSNQALKILAQTGNN